MSDRKSKEMNDAWNQALHLLKSYDCGGDENIFFNANLTACAATTQVSCTLTFIGKSLKLLLHLSVITTALQFLTGEAAEMSRKAESLTEPGGLSY